MHQALSRRLRARTPWRSALATAAVALPAFATQAAVTAPYGFDQPFDNAQPSLALQIQLPTTGPNYPGLEVGGADSKALGVVRTYANFRAPFGGDIADGRLLGIRENTALFSLIGTQYGGDGRTTFAMPDLRGRTIVDAGHGFIGDVTGSRLTTITTAQLPAHRHAIAGGDFTGFTGSGQPVDNRQPTLAMRYVIAVEGDYPTFGTSNSAAPTFIGQVAASATNLTSGGFMYAEGQLLPIDQYTNLYSVIGTTYGGDGQLTFALPDLRGRTIIGAGQGNGLSRRTLGEVVGSDTFTLTASQMPMHAHALGNGTGSFPTGGHDGVDNMQPSLTLNYIIATSGVFPPFDCCAGIEESVIGEITAFAGSFAPDGWMMADGRLLEIRSHSALFSLLGTTYGGDGVRTFALPDLRGRAIVGAGGNLQVGTTLGTEGFTVVDAQLPSHAHTMPVPEPQTWALLLAGLVSVAGIVRRRQ